jgi:hypothetical protein
VNAPTSRSEVRQARWKDLLVVSLWSAIGLATALTMAWFGLGYMLDGG